LRAGECRDSKPGPKLGIYAGSRENTSPAGAVPAPAFALRLALGEMADALLLVSQKVLPAKLVNSGYRFLHPGLADGLEKVHRKNVSSSTG